MPQKNSGLAETLLRAAEELPLEDLGDVLNVLAGRVQAHRAKNSGFVPREIFAACVALGGVYPCVEVIVQVYEGEHFRGFAVKKRGGNEQGWEGEYQIVGQAARLGAMITARRRQSCRASACRRS